MVLSLICTIRIYIDCIPAYFLLWFYLFYVVMTLVACAAPVHPTGIPSHVTGRSANRHVRRHDGSNRGRM